MSAEMRPPLETRGPSRPAQPSRPVREFQLPAFDDQRLPGARMVRRTVALTLAVAGIVAGIALGVALMARIRVTIDTAGVLEPARVWPVRASYSGRVEHVHVSSGDTVAAGAVLIALDTFELQVQLAQARARREALERALDGQRTGFPLDVRRDQEDQARAAAILMRADASLRDRLLEFQIVGDLDSIVRTHRAGLHIAIDRAIAELLIARADVEAARIQRERSAVAALQLKRAESELAYTDAEVQAAERRLARALLRAPAAGIVVTTDVEHLLGMTVREGDALVEVAEPSQWRVVVFVSEREVGRVRVGDPVDLDVPAASGRTGNRLLGRVISVAAERSDPSGASMLASETAGGRRSGAGGYRLVIAIDTAGLSAGERDALRRGYSVQAVIVTRRERAIRLLIARLVRTRSGGS